MKIMVLLNFVNLFDGKAIGAMIALLRRLRSGPREMSVRVGELLDFF